MMKSTFLWDVTSCSLPIFGEHAATIVNFYWTTRLHFRDDDILQVLLNAYWILLRHCRRVDRWRKFSEQLMLKKKRTSLFSLFEMSIAWGMGSLVSWVLHTTCMRQVGGGRNVAQARRDNLQRPSSVVCALPVAPQSASARARSDACRFRINIALRWNCRLGCCADITTCNLQAFRLWLTVECCIARSNM
jgi:hypothetical protein